jgi:hypothetical protein
MKRTDLLIERSLLSVYQQKKVNPKEIFIIDDNIKKESSDYYSTEYHNIKWRVLNFRKEFLKKRFNDGVVPEWYFHTTVLPNKRTQGNSGTGAWNTALYQSIMYGKKNYIAILDDDDEWNEHYLKRCLDETKVENKESNKEFVLAVITCIIRREKERDILLKIDENNFMINNFYIGNPGFQGSNIFIRLREFLKLGCFDESLKSTTDRDVAIRLIELKNTLKYSKFKFIAEPLVIHHAENENRVTAIYKNKKMGLDLFYRKYMHLMADDVKKLSLQRAQDLFNYDYVEIEQKPKSFYKSNEYKGKPFNLIIGVISSELKTLKEFLKSFNNISNKELLNDYIIIILENTDNEYEIRPIISYFMNKKSIKIELVEIEQQEIICKTYPFHCFFEEEKINKKSIAFSRSLLQWIVYNRSNELFNSNCVAWIIDDDNMFNNLSYDEVDGKTIIHNQDFLSLISYFKYNDKKIDAILGTVTDAPPLPFLSSLRTQILDLVFNLKWFMSQNPEKIFDRNIGHNFSFMENNRDFYYDLSSEYYEHLECPFWWYPIEEECKTNYKAFKAFLKEISLIRKGTNVFRPIILSNHSWGAIIGESIYRGGNTIIYDLEMLKIPNIIANISKDNKKLLHRRSDFNWAIINKYIFNKKIYEITIPLRHHRRLQTSTIIINQKKLSSDLIGMVFYRTLEEILKKRFEKNKEKMFKDAVNLFQKIYRDYIKRLKINITRTEFLLKTAITILKNKKFWWYKNEYRPNLNDNIQKAIYSLKTLSYEISKRRMQEYIKSISKDGNLINNNIYVNVINKIEEIQKNNIFY